MDVRMGGATGLRWATGVAWQMAAELRSPGASGASATHLPTGLGRSRGSWDQGVPTLRPGQVVWEPESLTIHVQHSPTGEEETHFPSVNLSI